MEDFDTEYGDLYEQEERDLFYEGAMDFYDDDPSPYEGTYSED